MGSAKGEAHIISSKREDRGDIYVLGLKGGHLFGTKDKG